MSSKSNNNNNFIKQFHSYSNNDNLWKKMDNNITLKDHNKNLLLENDIIVKGTIQNPSDVNLKTNIIEITEVEANKVSLLRPVTYTYIGDSKSQEHYGLIAQEVEKHFPHLVNDNLFYNYKSINYVELIPILVSKIQQLENEIEHLKSRF